MKQELNKIGVYTITNLVNGKIYVGSTTNIFLRRKGEHFTRLENNKHQNKHLQSSYNKYGKENFKFEVLEECNKEYCASTEQFWMNILNVCNPKFGYNKRVIANSNYGCKRTEEHKRKFSIVHKGRIVSEETKKKISNSSKGKTFSKETLQKILLARTKYIIYQYDLQMNLIKIHKEGRTKAAKDSGVTKSNISNCINGRGKTAGGFIWKKELKKKGESIG